MTPALQQALFTKYPILYSNVDQPRSLMNFGLEVGDGWYELINDLSAKLEAFNANIHASQVKEKWGGLRFYIDGAPEAIFKEVYAAIDKAEKLSYKICELCGKPGKPNKSGWIMTRCKECAKSTTHH